MSVRWGHPAARNRCEARRRGRGGAPAPRITRTPVRQARTAAIGGAGAWRRRCLRSSNGHERLSEAAARRRHAARRRCASRASSAGGESAGSCGRLLRFAAPESSCAAAPAGLPPARRQPCAWWSPVHQAMRRQLVAELASRVARVPRRRHRRVAARVPTSLLRPALPPGPPDPYPLSSPDPPARWAGPRASCRARGRRTCS